MKVLARSIYYGTKGWENGGIGLGEEKLGTQLLVGCYLLLSSSHKFLVINL